MSERFDAVIVGSGPNGLAAAITLARAGRSVCVLEAKETIGGGARSGELTLPGFTHDICSAVHPMGVSSPFFSALPLDEFGLEWVHPTVPLAHPLDDGSAGVLYRDFDAIVHDFGKDGATYRSMVEPLSNHWNAIAAEILQPMVHVPRSPLLMARLGLLALRSASGLASSKFDDAPYRALFAGLAGHAILPLDKWMTASFGLVLAMTAHAAGWPFAKGGSQAIPDAMAAYLRSLGGEIRTGTPVRTLRDLPRCRAVFFDVAPRKLVDICGPRLHGRYRRQLLGYRPGEAVFKVDYALSGPVPWSAPACHDAGTVHLGGTLEEIVAAEHEVANDRIPDRPLVLVAQQSQFDPTRAPAGQHTFWAYCHVPYGSTVDMTERIERQVERFAPGFRDVIMARSAMFPSDIGAHNENMEGGDIAGGSNGGLQLFFRPGFRLRPYSTPLKGVYICSASTPPGGGVHGMCGYHAARAALRRELR